MAIFDESSVRTSGLLPFVSHLAQVTRSIDMVIQRDPDEARLRHDADINYVITHTTAKWATSFIKDLEMASEPLHQVTNLVSALARLR